MNHQPAIGEWRFDIDGAALTKQGCITRLEDRSARTLALLCRRRGEVVSKAEMLEEVWSGRTVSANSVAIVIADLRRALGEDARTPQHIETVGKRGYRLSQEPESQSGSLPAVGRSGMRPAIRLFSVIAPLAAIMLALLWSETRPAPSFALSLEPVQNQTGEARYDPLAKALAALIEERLVRMPGIVATEPGQKSAVIAAEHSLDMQARLIIWNDTPTLSLSAIDPSSGKVVWSAMAVGRPDAIADATIVKLADFRRTIARP